jgi:hypothetical protein
MPARVYSMTLKIGNGFSVVAATVRRYDNSTVAEAFHRGFA